MKEQDIREIERIIKIGENLRCPHCGHGIQIEYRNCSMGYTQYRCGSCMYVESSESRLNRAIAEGLRTKEAL